MSAKDAVATMGDILPDDAGGRDAVHVAVVSCVAQSKLHPGQHIGIGERDGKDYAADASATKQIGIVDPYIEKPVMVGQRFWLYLYPRSITGLSHRWTHPAFNDDANADASYAPPSVKLASEQWLRNFCKTADCPGYESVMRLIKEGDYADGGEDGYPDYYCGRIDAEYMHFGGSDAHGEIPTEFWTHVENVLGHPVKYKPTYFSCSC